MNEAESENERGGSENWVTRPRRGELEEEERLRKGEGTEGFRTGEDTQGRGIREE